MRATLERLRNALGAARRAHALREGATAHRVVWRSGPACLRAYAPAEPAATTPLLLVTPIINRFRVVDLEPEGSLVASLAARGLPVYVLDWGQPTRLDAGCDFEDYVLRYLPGARRAIPHAGPVDLLGYCLGGTLAVLFAARFPEAVRRLATLHAPVEFSRPEEHMDLLRRWVEPAHFPVERLTAAFGNMPGALVAQGFVWQRPLASAQKPWRAWRRFGERAFADSFAALESWNVDAVDVPGAAYRRLIGELYREDRLARGTFRLGGELVDLGRITHPLLVVTAKGDTTCPPPAAKALLRLARSAAPRELELAGGHVTSVVGRRARAALHDPLAEFFLA